MSTEAVGNAVGDSLGRTSTDTMVDDGTPVSSVAENLYSNTWDWAVPGATTEAFAEVASVMTGPPVTALPPRSVCIHWKVMGRPSGSVAAEIRLMVPPALTDGGSAAAATSGRALGTIDTVTVEVPVTPKRSATVTRKYNVDASRRSGALNVGEASVVDDSVTRSGSLPANGFPFASTCTQALVTVSPSRSTPPLERVTSAPGGAGLGVAVASAVGARLALTVTLTAIPVDSLPNSSVAKTSHANVDEVSLTGATKDGWALVGFVSEM